MPNVETVVASNQTKEVLNDLRLAILNQFNEIWVFHHFNLNSDDRYLKVCSVWDAPLPEDKFNKIKQFSELFLLNYKKTPEVPKKKRKKSKAEA